ncbi:hypothetical protein K503DRAFT_778825 [Rhizopogon vinicolor AM-OR11-026]|uniref:Uncharacterized protein n=1 Tax=Rhizopogon vinicolor AM-OR11-026 TaxID=1314800 RepID=A0A1B7NGS6_9AGAM|nr:hypothetical protein K503DRAFT_778825 [Rhizopogon vinicolor AM-OR11-026]
MDKGPGTISPIFRSLRVNFSSHWSIVQFSKSMKFKLPSSSSSSSSSSSCWKRSNDDVRLSIQFHWDLSVAIQPPIIFDICQMVTQGTIRSLSLSSSKDLQEYFWRTGSANLPELEDDSQDLHDIIVTRGSLCASLNTLRLADCKGLMEDEVELLEEVVEDVDWDGHEEVFSESESEPDSYYRCESTCDLL